MLKLTDLHYAWATLQAFCSTIEIYTSRQRSSCQRCNCVIIIVSSSKHLRGKTCNGLMLYRILSHAASISIVPFADVQKNFCIFPNPYTKVFRKNTESLKSSAQQPCEIFSLIIWKNFPRNPSCDLINVEYTCNCAFFNDKTRRFYYYFINQWTKYDRF